MPAKNPTPPDDGELIPDEPLHDHIDQLGLSQVRFAHLAGVNDRTVRRWLSGELETPACVHRLAIFALELQEADPIRCAELIEVFTGRGDDDGGTEQPTPPRADPMTGKAFAYELENLGLSQSEFAQLTLTNPHTVRRWADQEQYIPSWVGRFMRLVDAVQSARHGLFTELLRELRITPTE